MISTSMFSVHSAHYAGVKKVQKKLKDKGTCLNCKYQGDCPYTQDCSRSYYHKIYTNKIDKAIDKFELE